MTKTFTKNDLLKFLYDELEPLEKKEIQQAIFTDSSLQELLLEMRTTQSLLDNVQMKTPRSVTEKILSFSKSYQPESA